MAGNFAEAVALGAQEVAELTGGVTKGEGAHTGRWVPFFTKDW